MTDAAESAKGAQNGNPLRAFERIVLLRTQASDELAAASPGLAEPLDEQPTHLRYVDLIHPEGEQHPASGVNRFAAYAEATADADRAGTGVAILEWRGETGADGSPLLQGLGVPRDAAAMLAQRLEQVSQREPRPALEEVIDDFRATSTSALVDLCVSAEQFQAVSSPRAEVAGEAKGGVMIGLREAILFSIIACAVAFWAAYQNLTAG